MKTPPDNYFKIILSYEIPYNVLDSNDPEVKGARDIFYDKLKESIPQDRYEKFSLKLSLFQLKDKCNYLVTYEAFFRAKGRLPMEEYVDARDLKDSIQKEFEDFFASIDCDYQQLNIKTLL